SSFLPRCFLLAVPSSLFPPRRFFLAVSSSLFPPRCFLLAVSSSLFPPRCFLLAVLASSAHYRSKVLEPRTQTHPDRRPPHRPAPSRPLGRQHRQPCASPGRVRVLLHRSRPSHTHDAAREGGHRGNPRQYPRHGARLPCRRHRP